MFLNYTSRNKPHIIVSVNSILLSRAGRKYAENRKSRHCNVSCASEWETNTRNLFKTVYALQNK